MTNSSTTEKYDGVAPSPETLTVTGAGSAASVPDAIIVRFTIESKAPDALGAYQGSTEISARFLSELATLSIPANRVKTTNANVNANMQWVEGKGNVVDGYLATHQLQVRLKTDQSDIIEKVFALVNNDLRLDSLSYALDDDAAAYQQAQAAAWENAVAQGEYLAGLAGKTLGATVAISTNAAPSGPIPMGKMLASAEFAPGESETTAAIQVTFALN